MDEVTLRLPAETRESLQAEADERGVPLDSHIRDIVDAYCASGDRPAVHTRYLHSCESGSDRLDPPERDTIGSFSYGSRSVIR